MEELSYVLVQYFVSCVHVRFYFSLPLIFTLLVASISHFLTAALNFHVFLPKKFVSWSSSFSVVHVNVNIKNNAEKDTTMLLFVLLNKTLSCFWVAIPVDWVILNWYACGADGQSLARSVYGHVITKFSWMGKTSNFLVTHYFHGGIVVCAYPIFRLLCSCSLLLFIAAHFHLAGR